MLDRDTVIEALQYLISGECTDTQFDYLDEIEAAITLLKEQKAIESINFGDRTDIMANLEGLTWDDWRMYHSDTEVQNIAKSAFYLLITLLKEQETIVRCKDCKWYSGKGFCKHPNGGAGNVRPANWFCADGERK